MANSYYRAARTPRFLVVGLLPFLARFRRKGNGAIDFARCGRSSITWTEELKVYPLKIPELTAHFGVQLRNKRVQCDHPIDRESRMLGRYKPKYRDTGPGPSGIYRKTRAIGFPAKRMHSPDRGWGQVGPHRKQEDEYRRKRNSKIYPRGNRRHGPVLRWQWHPQPCHPL